MTTYPLLVTDRTTIETDWECGMKRWWYREHDGTGIVPAVEKAYFSEGREIHADLHALALAEDPLLGAVEFIEGITEKMVAAEGDQLLLEPLCRRAGWVAAVALYVEPSTRRDYETVFLEHELVLERSPLWIAVTPDRVLRQRSAPNKLVEWDYKGVGGWGATMNWMEYWPYAIQQHTILKAIEEEVNEAPAHGRIMGLYKGQQKDGRLHHPYVWAFYDTDTGEWWPLGSGKRGLTYRPVWEYDGGILEWVKKCGPEVAASMFPFSRPIFLNDRLLEWTTKSRTHRELTVYAVREACQKDLMARAIHFEPRFSKCRPVVGDSCPYLSACHNATINADPVGSGLYVPRTPHHDVEVLMKGADNEDS